MSLKIVIVLVIALALAASVAIGGAVTYWQVERRVAVETEAALAHGENVARRAAANLSSTADPRTELTRLVRAFDGNRHVTAALLDGSGAPLVSSEIPAPENQAPEWFYGLLARAPKVANVALTAPVEPYGGLRLSTDSRGEIDEIWGESLVDAAMLALFCALTLVFITLTLGRVLRPLDALAVAFERIGRGDYGPRVDGGGPIEFDRLARGFNEMAARLAEMEGMNRRLSAQLETVQDEERADLARDLHDEVSPLLFSVDVDAAAIQQAAGRDGIAAIGERATAIRGAIAETKKHVQDILGRLRPAALVDFGLPLAIGGLVAFWTSRRPDVAIDVSVPDLSWGARLDGAVHGVVREGLSNALQHARPTRIEISVTESEGGLLVRIADDGGGFRPPGPSPGFGVINMKERVAALGGDIFVRDRGDAPGVEVTARLPLDRAPAETGTPGPMGSPGA